MRWVTHLRSANSEMSLLSRLLIKRLRQVGNEARNGISDHPASLGGHFRRRVENDR
jgi:hypothetical protein